LEKDGEEKDDVMENVYFANTFRRFFNQLPVFLHLVVNFALYMQVDSLPHFLSKEKERLHFSLHFSIKRSF
jgi:hypothetical protein